MTLKQYLFTMLFATILCWIAWGFVIFNIDPFQANAFSFVFFYLTLFFSLVGTLSLLSFIIYNFFSKSLLPMYRYVQKSFHNALFISGMIIILLFLQGQQLLNIWNLTIFILIVALVTSFIFSTKNKSNKLLNQ